MTLTTSHDQVQFNYASHNYQQFQEDFYQAYCDETPLVFLEKDLLRHMVNTGKAYFKLSKHQSKDHKDHYFLFEAKTHPARPHITTYTYLGHTSH